VADGVAIIEGLRGHTTGYAIPQFVIDGPGGGGKIPINPNYLVDTAPGRVTLRNFEGNVFEYPDPSPMPRVEMEKLQRQVFQASEP
jgi:lysine 2,3-aminomutase